MGKHLWVIIVLLLFGCSAHEITQQDITASKDIEDARASCYEAMAKQSGQDAIILASIPQKDRTMAAIIYLQGKQTQQVIAAATGNPLDMCSNTNLWDYMSAEVRSKNVALTAGLGVVSTAVRWVAGAWAVTEIIDGVGSTLSAGGDIIDRSSDSGNISHGVKTNNTVANSHDWSISDDPQINSAETSVDYGDSSSNDENIWGGDRTQDESTEANNDQEWAPTDDHSDNSTTKTKTKTEVVP